jgi:hypothetical protein
LGTPYHLSPPIVPSVYLAVVCRLALSFLSQPRLFASLVRSVSRPCLESRPAVALPFLYSMMSGALSELRIIWAFCWICSKPFSSNLTSTPGCEALNSSIALFHAMPIALVGPS